MSYHQVYKTTAFLALFCMFALSVNAQEQAATKTTVQLERVLKERKRLLDNGYIKNYYSIQVFSGDITNAKKVLSECKVDFEDRSEIIYETPNYKVQIGKYRTRLDADRAFQKISEKYPSAFVFEPKGKK